MISWVKKNKLDLTLISLFLLSLPLFFYKLGQSSLVSWDEAWYADIARNLLRGGNPFDLWWNGSLFTDHPPFGFWLMAISFKLFGVSDFTARLSSALLGFSSLIVIYLLGKELFNRWVGFLSAVGLTSAIWFVYRSREGDLDAPLTFMFLLTFYLAVLANKSKKFLIPLAFSFCFLVLTKTLVPLTVLPSLVIIFWGNKSVKLKDLKWPVIIVLVILGSWVVSETFYAPGFWQRYFAIGLPGIKAQADYLANLKLAKQYLHDGIGKWFWPGVLGMLGGLFFFQRRFLLLSAFFVAFFVPFIFSPKGQIWHLIPLQPFMILAALGFLFVLGEKVLKLVKLKKLLLVLPIGLVLVTVYLTAPQVRANWYQFVDIPQYISDEAIISTEAGKYSQVFYIDGDYSPAAVFYSHKYVQKINHDDLEKLLNDDSQQYLLMTNDWRLTQVKITSTQNHIVKKDRDKILIFHGNY